MRRLVTSSRPRATTTIPWATWKTETSDFTIIINATTRIGSGFSEIAENSAPVSVALSRQMLWRMLGADHPMRAHMADSRGILYRGRSADAREGVESFLAKRPAQFTDRVSTDLPDLFPGWAGPEFT